LSPDLEDELRAVLRLDADAAPHLDSTWTVPDPAEPNAARTRNGWMLAAASVAVVAAGLVGVVSVSRNDGNGVAPTDSAVGPAPSVSASISPTAPPTTMPAVATSSAPATSVEPQATGLAASIADAIGVDGLELPPWFSSRSTAPSCGTWVGDTATSQSDDLAPLDCFSTAIANDERAQIVTVHTGDDLKVARWIVALGTGPYGAEQFEVASLVVDDRAGTTRWAETRCVEGVFVDGRLAGDFVVDRNMLDQLHPSGTTVTEDGAILELPGPDDRTQLQPCNGPVVVDRPFVTPLEATGMRVGDEGSDTGRFPGYNEIGEPDLTIVSSWTPVGANDPVRIIGFVYNDLLDPRPPPQTGGGPTDAEVIYADDGTTRIGQFGPDGRPALDT
jgi:hypothetical protein